MQSFPRRRLGLSATLLAFSATLWAQTSLTITTSSLPPGAVGQPYAVQLSATGGAPPYSWSISGQLPPGLTALASGVITGNPTAGGVYNFSAVLRDNSGATVSKSLSITIGGTGSQLKVTTTTLPAATVGQPYGQQQLSATGGSPPYQWAAQGLPAGLQLSSAGVVSGTPTAAGTATFTVQVTDAAKNAATGQVQLVVQPAPISITTVPPLFVGTVGTPYAQSFSASGGITPYTWSILSGSTDGLTLDPATGNLAGTPQAAGTFNFTIQVKDSAGAAATASYSLVVNAPTLIITVGSALPSGTVGVPYSQTLPVQASGGTPPYTWSLVGSAPPGLSLDPSTLLLNGTPTTAGPFSFTIQVADSAGLTATRNLSITIAPAGLSITTSRQLASGVLNAPYTQQLTATGGQQPYRWSATGLPAGLSINTTTGLISGTPTAAGAFGVAITVSDAALTNVSDRFTMNIALPQPPPVTISGLPQTVSPAQQYSIQISIGTAYPAPITGQAILSFSPESGPTDRTIQFSSGGTTANFTIPTGSTTADALSIQTGTVAGTITVSLRLQAGGLDITPSPAPAATTQLPRGAPVIRSVQVNRSGSTLNVVVTGYSTAREVTQAGFAFSAASGQTLQPTASSITIDVTTLFGTWFLDPANSQYGSVFIFTQPFTIQGDVNAVTPLTVTLTNRIGSVTANVTP